MRKQHQAFGRGSIEFLEPGNRKVLAFLREYEGETLLCVANLSRFVAGGRARPRRASRARVPVELFGPRCVPADRRAAATCSPSGRTASSRFASRVERRRPAGTSSAAERSCRCWCWPRAGARASRGRRCARMPQPDRNATQSRLSARSCRVPRGRGAGSPPRAARSPACVCGDSAEWITAAGGWLMALLDVALESGRAAALLPAAVDRLGDARGTTRSRRSAA